MFLLFGALAILPNTAQSLFDACAAHLGRLSDYSVEIQTFDSLKGENREQRLDLAVDGSDGMLRIRQPASGNLDRSDRTYLVRGGKLLAYDAVADEALHRKVPASGALESRLSSQLGPLDLAVGIAVSSADLSRFLDGFRGFRDWRMSHSGDVQTVERYAGSSSTLLRFTGSNPLLTEVRFKAAGSAAHWTFGFRRGASLALDVPNDARSVSSFTEREAPPKYASVEAKQVVARMIKAYGALHNATVDIKADDGESRMILSGRRLREDRAGLVWAYDGLTLAIRDTRTGKFYRGKAVRPILAEYITKVGGEVDPLIKRIVNSKVPYMDLFPRQATVRLVGSSDSDDILDVTSPRLRVSLFVRRGDHLIDSMESETVDRPGHTQTRSSRRFSYSNLGQSTPIELFQPSPGTSKVRQLPEVESGP